MNKIFFDVGITLDGFVAGLNGGVKNPLGDDGIKIHQWMFKQKSFLEHLGMKGGAAGNKDDDIIKKTLKRIGANIMGKRMFVEGEANWPEEAPFHTPVFVLTHEKREPWERPGGTTFYFINDGIESALQQAKKAAGNKDIRISGGANVIQSYISNGYIDEFTIHIAPLIFGDGVRLFENIDKKKFFPGISNVVNSPEVTHIYYKNKKS